MENALSGGVPNTALSTGPPMHAEARDAVPVPRNSSRAEAWRCMKMVSWLRWRMMSQAQPTPVILAMLSKIATSGRLSVSKSAQI